MSKGTLKMCITSSGKTTVDMTDFKKCGDTTDKLMNEMGMEIDDLKLKEEQAEVNTVVHQQVKR